jgi:hypothetical protein
MLIHRGGTSIMFVGPAIAMIGGGVPVRWAEMRPGIETRGRDLRTGAVEGAANPLDYAGLWR